jgi:hypothetical protein
MVVWGAFLYFSHNNNNRIGVVKNHTLGFN